MISGILSNETASRKCLYN